MMAEVELCEKLGKDAVLALLLEVSASPKPGLVDRFNRGAHKDMDFFTFMESSAALSSYFVKCARLGAEFRGDRPPELFNSLRPLGMAAEQAMFDATDGVNTHKGLVFSLGIICAAAACCMVEQQKARVDADALCERISRMTAGLCSRELDSLKKTEGLTNGETLYRKFGLKGIRGEVENGFPAVRNCSLPAFRHLKSQGACHMNDRCVQTLLHLMAVNEDTNIVARHDMDTLAFVQGQAQRVLDAGGMLTDQGRQMIYKLDEDFIKRNISPGGSADLLAVTIMLDRICSEGTERASVLRED
ncbi:triphosphoribosyl-dephospho-CoA synthase CitG [Paenibacillus thiaminolyticus]|uniref:triphosphoribosyl-dephospho-CoA synthase CitG n=1 Tax=Paenibacillus thiaminolyticus TaxID=49283 RepID=UPI0011646A56|nr:triphosphoribosyl-dephospho-CoA synthase CitG [Paenibacillus thiaminolyticus]NGP61024.1 triphosphoribosyl-dephospho-CoA synthase CitG [Paenibacillus thiaminolyticus]